MAKPGLEKDKALHFLQGGKKRKLAYRIKLNPRGNEEE